MTLKVKVNKNQVLDNYERDVIRFCHNHDISLSHTTYTGSFETENITVEQLLDYVNKGYGIKINC